MWLCRTHLGKEVQPCVFFRALISHSTSIPKVLMSAFLSLVQSLHLLLAPIRGFFVLLCIVFFVTESFESFSLRFVSFSPKSQGFWTLQESGLESCYMSGCQKCSGGAATNSSVSHCFSVFGCALWQPSLGALTPEF